MILRSYWPASSSAAFSSSQLRALETPTEDPRLAGLTNMGYGRRLQISSGSDVPARDHQMLHHRNPALPAQPLHDVLVHRNRGRQHARADVGQAGQFQQTLHGAVFAEGSVQRGKDHVDAGIAVRARAKSRAAASALPW